MPRKNGKPVTKSDLNKGMKIVRSDLRKELKSFRSELKNEIARVDKKIDRVAISLVGTQQDVREIKRTMATKADINRILGAIDAFAARAEAYDRKSLTHSDILQGHQASLKNHENRISYLESPHR